MKIFLFVSLILGIIGFIDAQIANIADVQLLAETIQHCKEKYDSIYDQCSSVPSDEVCSFYRDHMTMHPATAVIGTTDHTMKYQLHQQYLQYCNVWCSLCLFRGSSVVASTTTAAAATTTAAAATTTAAAATTTTATATTENAAATTTATATTTAAAATTTAAAATTTTATATTTEAATTTTAAVMTTTTATTTATPTTSTTTITTPPVSKCNYSNVLQSRIANGSPARQCQYPWMVAIRNNPFGAAGPSYVCAGVLKNDTVVLTSNTCANKIRDNNIPVVCVVGEHAWDVGVAHDDVIPCTLLGSSSTDGGVEELQLNNSSNDYMTGCIAPACLQTALTKPDLDNCTFAAWGSTNDQTVPDMSSGLLFGRLPVVKDCSGSASLINEFASSWSRPKQFVEPTNNVLCSQTSPSTAHGCQGDEGGALMCRDRDTGELITVGVTDHGQCPGTTWFREISQ